MLKYLRCHIQISKSLIFFRIYSSSLILCMSVHGICTTVQEPWWPECKTTLEPESWQVLPAETSVDIKHDLFKSSTLSETLSYLSSPSTSEFRGRGGGGRGEPLSCCSHITKISLNINTLIFLFSLLQR